MCPSRLYIHEGSETVIRVITDGGNISSRHVPHTDRVHLDWLLEKSIWAHECPSGTFAPQSNWLTL